MELRNQAVTKLKTELPNLKKLNKSKIKLILIVLN